jgi:hypothetical protein
MARHAKNRPDFKRKPPSADPEGTDGRLQSKQQYDLTVIFLPAPREVPRPGNHLGAIGVNNQETKKAQKRKGPASPPGLEIDFA